MHPYPNCFPIVFDQVIPLHWFHWDEKMWFTIWEMILVMVNLWWDMTWNPKMKSRRDVTGANSCVFIRVKPLKSFAFSPSSKACNSSDIWSESAVWWEWLYTHIFCFLTVFKVLPRCTMHILHNVLVRSALGCDAVEICDAARQGKVKKGRCWSIKMHGTFKHNLWYYHFEEETSWGSRFFYV